MCFPKISGKERLPPRIADPAGFLKMNKVGLQLRDSWMGSFRRADAPCNLIIKRKKFDPTAELF
jgi:hypothetical protein